MSNIENTVVTKKDFDSTVADIIKVVEEQNMRVLHIHDVQGTLASRGFKRDQFKMIEFCNAHYAHTILERDSKAGVFLPCKISVYVKGNQTHVSAFNFKTVADMFNDPLLKNIFTEIDTVIKKVISN